MKVSWTRKVILLCFGVLGACVAGQDLGRAGADNIALDAKALYAGFEATKVLLDKDGKQLALDARVFKFCKEQTGVVMTDVIDLLPGEGIIGAPGEVRSGRPGRRWTS
jgi:hypothetical protein